MAVRTIPVLIEYCELIKKYAPDAWIFNFTNPSGLVTQALRSAGYDKIIGICDAPSSTKSVWPVIWVWKKTICMWNFSA